MNLRMIPVAGAVVWLLSIYAPYISAAPADTLGSVIVYPNPMNAHETQEFVTFDNLPSAVRVRIYTMNGTCIFDKQMQTVNGSARWDAVNDSGNKVAPGLYLYLITSGSLRPAKGKVVILR